MAAVGVSLLYSRFATLCISIPYVKIPGSIRQEANRVDPGVYRIDGGSNIEAIFSF